MSIPTRVYGGELAALQRELDQWMVAVESTMDRIRHHFDELARSAEETPTAENYARWERALLDARDIYLNDCSLQGCYCLSFRGLFVVRRCIRPCQGGCVSEREPVFISTVTGTRHQAMKRGFKAAGLVWRPRNNGGWMLNDGERDSARAFAVVAGHALQVSCFANQSGSTVGAAG